MEYQAASIECFRIRIPPIRLLIFSKNSHLYVYSHLFFYWFLKKFPIYTFIWNRRLFGTLEYVYEKPNAPKDFLKSNSFEHQRINQQSIPQFRASFQNLFGFLNDKKHGRNQIDFFKKIKISEIWQILYSSPNAKLLWQFFELGLL